MKKIINIVLILAMFCGMNLMPLNKKAFASDADYYTIYNAEKADEVLFMRGSDVHVSDEYISADNKRYIIEEVDDDAMTGKARYIENVKMPVYNITKNNDVTVVNAANAKKVGMYHTHNDECYNDVDGTDSVYGKGGIHDVGKKLKAELEKLGIEVFYSEDLHLPHDSGAYTRSNATAAELLRNGLDALFDVHRDATPRKEYITSVNGETMSKVRMVVGASNANSQLNKEFALNIKAYADEVYPGLIKDIYIGKGNYNQQLFERAMLFEFGTNTIEKEYVLRSTIPLAKTIDVVLFGTNEASDESLKDINTEVSSGDILASGMTGEKNLKNEPSSGLSTLAIIFIVLGSIAAVFGIIMAFSKKARHGVARFFKEMFAIGKRKNA